MDGTAMSGAHLVFDIHISFWIYGRGRSIPSSPEQWCLSSLQLMGEKEQNIKPWNWTNRRYEVLTLSLALASAPALINSAMMARLFIWAAKCNGAHPFYTPWKRFINKNKYYNDVTQYNPIIWRDECRHSEMSIMSWLIIEVIVR